MKPVKNKIYCKNSSQTKMLFEDENKANNFMKFNGNTILEEAGYKPERSYYCISCGGWHLTSSKNPKNIKSKADIILDIYRNEIEKKEALKLKLLDKRTLQQEKFRNDVNMLEEKLENLAKHLS